MRYIIDRFEGDVAIAENEEKNFIDIPRRLLPESASEGDVLLKSAEGYTVDAEETGRRRVRIKNKMSRLFE
ncbi:MAG: DUF3006 domain-containing protein [Christensenellales bacterium]|jgi:hypothetical protein